MLQDMHHLTIVIANHSDHGNCVDSEMRILTMDFNYDWDLLDT